MSRIAKTFQNLAKNHQKALIPYITAGDPNPNITVDLLHALVAAGADIVELGVPFSDPMADGPTIQLACERALAHGTSLPQVLNMVKTFRETNQTTPVVLMGYMNPVENMGLANFAAQAQACGVDGVLLVDFPVEQAREVLPTLRQHELDCIFLIAPTSPAARIAKIAQEASGYLYYVSLKGVTGAATLDVESVKTKLAEMRTLTNLPLAVGFGIRDATTARAVSEIADAVIVGSALVNQIANDQHSPELILQNVPQLLRAMREAMDA